MFTFADILSYVVFTGFAFAALCVMTRGGRGWPWRAFSLAVLALVDLLVQWLWCFGEMPLDKWLAVCFFSKWVVVAALVFFLSRDRPGRRLFLSIAYGAYAVCYAVAFHLLAYRNVFGLPEWGAGVVGLAAVLGLNFVLFAWVLPSMPQDSQYHRWSISNVVAGIMAVSVFVSGVWPISVVAAPARYCSAFALASIVAWVAFPLLCRLMRDHFRMAAAEHSLELMMAEVKERRAAIDLARRLRHDQRHHRAQIAEYMLSGQHEKVFAYLKELDEEAREAPTDKLVWCGNETINAILSGASRKAAAKDVGFAAEVYVERAVALPDVELVAVVANLIENAIDAAGEVEKRDGGGLMNWSPLCRRDILSRQIRKGSHLCRTRQDAVSTGEGEKVKVEGEQWRNTNSTVQPATRNLQPAAVRVVIRQREFGIGITVTNPVPDGFALSDKGLPCAEPGIGMESVRRIVERHAGQWTYEVKDSILQCQVILMVG